MLDGANYKSLISGSNKWFDLTQTVVSGSVINTPIYNTLGGGSLLFNGTTQYVELGSVASYQFTNTQPFSISAWVNWTETTTAACIIFAYALLSSNNRGYYLGIDGGTYGISTNGFYFDYYDGSTFRGIQSAANTVTRNTWFNVTCTSSTVNSYTGMKIYFNGALLSTSVRSGGGGTPTSINYSGVTAQVGARQAQVPLEGYIGHTMVYNRELSAQEIQQNYNALKSRYGLR